MRGDKIGSWSDPIACGGQSCCEQCEKGHCCALTEILDRMPRSTHTHEIDTKKCSIHGRWECRKCGYPMPAASILPTISAFCVRCKVARYMQNAKSINMRNGRQAYKGTCSICSGTMYRIGVEPEVSSTKRPPKEVHIKDIETALHNLFCQDVGKNRINREAGLDLFDSHRKAANTLVDQLKLQGIKLVPDPDFEDKPKLCQHVAISIRKDNRTIGYKCVVCTKEAKFPE